MILTAIFKKYFDSLVAEIEPDQGKKSSKKTSKKDKEQAANNRPSAKSIEAVLKRYLRFCKDQQSVNFILWRKLGYANEDRSLEYQRNIKYALFLQQRNQIKLSTLQRKENGAAGEKVRIYQMDPSQLGGEITQLIPILKPETKQDQDEIEIEAQQQRHVPPTELLK